VTGGAFRLADATRSKATTRQQSRNLPAKERGQSRALEKAGVEFTDEDGGGPGVRLRKAKAEN
jgi:hypothetical protein